MDDSKLIFIISQPRSGSTLLQALLSNNSMVDTNSEHWMMLVLLTSLNSDKVRTGFDFKLASDAFKTYLEKTDSKKILVEGIRKVALQLYAQTKTKEENFVLDKTPRYYEIFDDIITMFPDAKYLILKRNPLDVLCSIMKTWSRTSIKELEKHHYRDILVGPGLIAAIEEKYRDQDNVMTIKYEDLVSDATTEVKEVCSWIGLEFDPEMIDYRTNKKFHGNYGDTNLLNKNRPDSTSVNSWVNYLNDPKYRSLINGYGDFLGKIFLEEYGYGIDYDFKKNNRFRLFKIIGSRKYKKMNPGVKKLLVSRLVSLYD